MNNTSIPPVVQTGLDEIDAALGKIAAEKKDKATRAEALFAEVSDLEVRERVLLAERSGMKKVLDALALSDQLELPQPQRKPKVMVETKALPILRARGAMKAEELRADAEVDDEASFQEWIKRAVRDKKIARMDDGTLEAL